MYQRSNLITAAGLLLISSVLLGGVIATNPSITVDLHPLDNSLFPSATYSATLKVDNCQTVTTSSVSTTVVYGMATIWISPQELCGYTLLHQQVTVQGVSYDLPDKELEPVDATAATVTIQTATRVRWIAEIE